ncbi:MAG: caa(3)-type oxidase subunit IV [Verrucomicrobia bacterium]|nr:MAG: caa(3)-type oxidase subunit IV [Verrucomicrobiota bacterium]
MNTRRPSTSKGLYWGVWGALLLLLFMTWGIAKFDLGHFNIVAAMTIAVMKMLLIILFFMHVRYRPRLTWLFVGAGFFWLFIMIVLTMGDYLTRGGP